MNNPFDYSTDHLAFLYHYTSIETFLDYVLPSGNLRLSAMGDVNDPKEAKFVSSSGATHEIPSPWTNRLAEFHEQRVKVLCLSKDRDELKITYSGRFVGYLKPAMWAHYGNAHKGVCLIFDRSRLTDQFSTHFGTADFNIHADVNYERHTHVSPGEIRSTHMHWTIEGHHFDPIELQRDFDVTVLTNLRNHHDKMFFRKHGDWSNENEYRYLVATGDRGYEFLPFADSLVGLAFGCDADNSRISSVARHCSGDMHLKRLSIDDFT